MSHLSKDIPIPQKLCAATIALQAWGTGNQTGAERDHLTI